MRKPTIIIALLILAAAVLAAPPAPEPTFGDVKTIDDCTLSCNWNTTNYTCHYGEKVLAECYAKNTTGDIVPYATYQFEVESPDGKIEHSQYWAYAYDPNQAGTPDTLDSAFWSTSGAGGGMSHEFHIGPGYQDNTPYESEFYVNATKGSTYFYVNGQSIRTLQYNHTIQSGENIQWIMLADWLDQKQCTARITDPTNNKVLREHPFTWEGTQHSLNIPSHGLAWQDYWLNVTCGRTTAQQTLNIAFNRVGSDDVKGWVALIAGNAQWIALTIFLLTIIGFAYRAYKRGVFT